MTIAIGSAPVEMHCAIARQGLDARVGAAERFEVFLRGVLEIGGELRGLCIDKCHAETLLYSEGVTVRQHDTIEGMALSLCIAKPYSGTCRIDESIVRHEYRARAGEQRTIVISAVIGGFVFAAMCVWWFFGYGVSDRC
jgi:hypothetical protein